MAVSTLSATAFLFFVGLQLPTESTSRLLAPWGVQFEGPLYFDNSPENSNEKRDLTQAHWMWRGELSTSGFSRLYDVNGDKIGESIREYHLLAIVLHPLDELVKGMSAGIASGFRLRNSVTDGKSVESVLAVDFALDATYEYPLNRRTHLSASFLPTVSSRDILHPEFHWQLAGKVFF